MRRRQEHEAEPEGEHVGRRSLAHMRRRLLLSWPGGDWMDDCAQRTGAQQPSTQQPSPTRSPSLGASTLMLACPPQTRVCFFF